MTATIWTTPVSTRRCTRCRTAASDSPIALPIAAYERRPSSWSCSMIAFETSSSGAWPGEEGRRAMGSIVPYTEGKVQANPLPQVL